MRSYIGSHMLRYLTVLLQNPAHPERAAIRAQALVMEGDFGLIVPPKMAEVLQLDIKSSRPIHTDSGLQHVAYAGPVEIQAKDSAAYTGALIIGGQLLIGAGLAEELGLTHSTLIPVTSAPRIAEKAEILPEAPVAQPASATAGFTAQDLTSLATRHIIPPASAPAPTALDLAPLHEELGLAARAAAHRILIVEHFLTDSECREICAYANEQKRERLGVVNFEKTTTKKVESVVDTKARDTFKVPIEGIETRLKSIFLRMFESYIEPFYNVQIEWWERPQLLCYTAGGKYGVHADADHWVKDESPKGGHWVRTHDRDISVLIYLNDEFTGGLLDFPNHGFKIQPKPGMLVAFPSHGEYLHGAEPTESGVRYALVSWSAAMGVPKVREKAPYKSVFMKDVRKQKANLA